MVNQTVEEPASRNKLDPGAQNHSFRKHQIVRKINQPSLRILFQQ